MACERHDRHEHTHGPDCGHVGIRHGNHVDYLHDGHLHHVHENHVDEHRLEVGGANPASCDPSHACPRYEPGHEHGEGCGHPRVPHGDHFDYLVDDHLHHRHGDHCDDHGPVNRA